MGKEQQTSGHISTQRERVPVTRDEHGNVETVQPIADLSKILEKPQFGHSTAKQMRQHSVIQMQRIQGNQAVQRMLATRPQLGRVQRIGQYFPYIGPFMQNLNPVSWAMRALGRALTAGEQSILEPIFGASVNYSMTRVRVGGVGSIDGTPRTAGNIINVPSEPVDRKTLIHECAHVWQHQNGIPFGYAISALAAQALSAIVTGSRDNAYDYSLMERYHIPWRHWNAEQQAKWIEDHESLPPLWAWQPGLPVPLEVPFN